MVAHTVTSFDEELAAIDRIIRDMGHFSAAMVQAATVALLEGEQDMARRVIADDAVMDARQRELDERAITLIGKRQPMADDLRTVVGAIRIASDLERIGDLAKNLGKRVAAVDKSPASQTFAHSIESMAELVQHQLERVVDIYIERDAEALVPLRADDEKIDVQYTAVFRELLTYMMEDPRNITACTHLLFCAKNLERIGDHVTNIAENAYYVMTGSQLPANRPKVDETGTQPSLA
ncbi:phosphate signaling complex protein PhoU [Tianweitania populi]|uniref:Phosphate-specific transport system accessory protein PhoU n=1 Tax=Tianweitania populi TaxID=1607949 RepID=A0A8J3DYS6_9HYPH|nr:MULTISPECIES: phosphate signaling complex protein PhoU [Tianweitania]GHD19871.1 phosphate transport system regulatory protein PhoU [Tianweitania populi]